MKKEEIASELDSLRAAAAAKKALIDDCEEGVTQLEKLKKEYEEICLDVQFLTRYYHKVAGKVYNA